jgi:hypothetical protein
MQSVNQTSDSKPAWLTAVGMAITAGAIRLLPHLPNFTPVGALGLFAGSRLRSWQAFAVPFLVMAVSDLLLWSWPIYGYKPFNPYVYTCFFVNVMLGRLFLRKGGLWRVPVVSLFASLLFFVVTNFGTWAGSDGSVYPKTMAGLSACYVAALPFAGNWDTDGTKFFFGTVAGDLAFSILFFGLYAVILHVLERRKASQTA